MTDAFDRALWRELAEDPVPDGLIRRRVLPALAHDVFIGESSDPGGNGSSIWRSAGSTPGCLPGGPPRRASRSRSRTRNPDLVRIRLTSTTRADASLFAEVANDVAASPVGRSRATVPRRAYSNRVVCVAELLRRQDATDFSLELAAGLFAELQVLRRGIPPGARERAVPWRHGADPTPPSRTSSSLTWPSR